MARTTKRHAGDEPPLTEQLRSIIRRRGLTDYTVAKGSGVAPSVVHRWMCGEREISGPTVNRIAAALDVKLQEGRGGLREGHRRN